MATPPYYTSADVACMTFGPVVQGRKIYVANLTEPLEVRTPPVELATSLGDPGCYVVLRPAGGFARFLADVEARVLQYCLENKEALFGKKVRDDDVLRTNFKSFFEEAGFRVRVKEGGVTVFDPDGVPVGPEEAPAGTCAHCVLRLTRACFGEREFGAMWCLEQARIARVRPCLIPAEASDHDELPNEGDDSPEEVAADPDEHEFQ